MRLSKYYMFSWLCLGIAAMVANIWMGVSWVVSGYIMDRWFRAELKE